MAIDFETFWLILITPAAVAAGVSLLIGWLVKGRLDAYFAKELKKYEHDLNVLAEGAKYDYQRRLQGSNLFVGRRHEVYAQVFRLLAGMLNTHRELKLVTLVPEHRALQSMGEARMLLERSGVPEDDVRGFLESWSDLGSEARAAAATEIVERSLNLRSYSLTFEFIDYIQAHGIYMSEEVEHAAKDAFGAVAARIDGQLQEKLDALRKMMRNELSAQG